MARFLPSLVRRVADGALDSMLRNLDERVRQVVDVAILDGVLLVDVAATTTTESVIHGLGRTPVGAIVVKSDAAAAYSRDNFTSETLDITSSSGTRTVSLWVF